MHDDEEFLQKGKDYIAASADISKIVRDLVRVAAEAVGSNMGALYLISRDRRVLQPAVVVNLPDEYIKGCGDIPLGQQCCGRAAQYKMPWYVDDIWTDPLFPPATRDGARRASVRAAFSIPVVSPRNECLGSLSAHFPEPHTPSEYEIERHTLFAQLIGFALSQEADVANRPIRPRSAHRLGDDDGRSASGTE